VPPHQLFLSASYEAPFGLFSAVELRSIDAYPVNSRNTIENWAYQVANLRLGLNRRWSGVTIRPFLGVDNVLDERYNGELARGPVLRALARARVLRGRVGRCGAVLSAVR
jgi:hypothetical protein